VNTHHTHPFTSQTHALVFHPTDVDKTIDAVSPHRNFVSVRAAIHEVIAYVIVETQQLIFLAKLARCNVSHRLQFEACFRLD
jgi:hypothetical protein